VGKNNWQRRKRVRAMRERMRRDYRVVGDRWPLAIGIDGALIEAYEGVETPGVIREALTAHCREPAYLRGLARTLERYDLDGAIAGEVARKHRALARHRLTGEPPPGMRSVVPTPRSSPPLANRQRGVLTLSGARKRR